MEKASQSGDPEWRNSLHEDVELTDRTQAKSDIAEPGFTPSTASARTNPPTDIPTVYGPSPNVGGFSPAAASWTDLLFTVEKGVVTGTEIRQNGVSENPDAPEGYGPGAMLVFPPERPETSGEKDA